MNDDTQQSNPFGNPFTVPQNTSVGVKSEESRPETPSEAPVPDTPTEIPTPTPDPAPSPAPQEAPFPEPTELPEDQPQEVPEQQGSLPSLKKPDASDESKAEQPQTGSNPAPFEVPSLLAADKPKEAPVPDTPTEIPAPTPDSAPSPAPQEAPFPQPTELPENQPQEIPAPKEALPGLEKPDTPQLPDITPQTASEINDEQLALGGFSPTGAVDAASLNLDMPEAEKDAEQITAKKEVKFETDSAESSPAAERKDPTPPTQPPAETHTEQTNTSLPSQPISTKKEPTAPTQTPNEIPAAAIDPLAAAELATIDAMNAEEQLPEPALSEPLEQDSEFEHEAFPEDIEKRHNLEPRIATTGEQLKASYIDLLIVHSVTLIINVALLWTGFDVSFLLGYVAAFFVVQLIYSILCELTPGHGTIGAASLGISITDMRFIRAKASAIVTRTVVQVATLGLSFLTVFFRNDNMSLHDKVAGTQPTTLRLSSFSKIAPFITAFALLLTLPAGFVLYSSSHEKSTAQPNLAAATEKKVESYVRKSRPSAMPIALPIKVEGGADIVETVEDNVNTPNEEDLAPRPASMAMVGSVPKAPSVQAKTPINYGTRTSNAINAKLKATTLPYRLSEQKYEQLLNANLVEFNGKAVANLGLVALKMRSVQAANDNSTLLLDARLSALLNMGEYKGGKAEIVIDEVANSSGQNVLNTNHRGETQSKLREISTKELDDGDAFGTRSVKLQGRLRTSDIQSIKGSVQLDIPVNVKKVQHVVRDARIPFKPQEYQGLEAAFYQGNRVHLTYPEALGNRIAAVVAYDQNNQPMDIVQTGSFSEHTTDHWVGFEGNKRIKAIQILIAEKMMQRSLPFNIEAY